MSEREPTPKERRMMKLKAAAATIRTEAPAPPGKQVEATAIPRGIIIRLVNLQNQ